MNPSQRAAVLWLYQRLSSTTGTTIANPRAVCPACGHGADRASSAGEDGAPFEGCPAVCINCAGVNVYKSDLTLRPATTADHARWPNNILAAIRDAQHLVRAANEARRRAAAPAHN